MPLKLKPSQIQSVMFDRNIWNKKNAVEWLKISPFIYNYPEHNPRITGQYFRFRQFDPSRCKEYKIKDIGHGIKFIIGI